MPQRILYDLDAVQLDHVDFDSTEIQRINPQRFEFAQLDSVALFRPEERIIVAVRDVRAGEFWTRGHMPGRPIFPGVLMLECAAQLCSFYTIKFLGIDVLYGFGGADKVRFRKIVRVGDRVIFLARPETITPRRSLFRAQGVVGREIAFEAEILGVALPATDAEDAPSPPPITAQGGGHGSP
jgi:3-hydroxyacyl-[acyl-carrier-protein] dehydratase